VCCSTFSFGMGGGGFSVTTACAASCADMSIQECDTSGGPACPAGTNCLSFGGGMMGGGTMGFCQSPDAGFGGGGFTFPDAGGGG
jgi:hypothetical protein